MINKRSLTIRSLMIAIVIMYELLPIVSRIFSTYLTTYAYMLLIVLLTLVLVFQQGISGLSAYIILLLPFILYLGLQYFMRTDSIIMWGYQSLLFALPLILAYFLTYVTDEDKRWIAKLVILLLTITVITTIIGCIQYPHAARYIATIASADEELATLYDWHNIGGYNMVYIVTLLYPLLIFAYKKHRVNLLITIAATVLIYAFVIVTEYTTAFLMLLISTALFFLPENMSMGRMVFVIILGAVAILVLREPVALFLKWLSTIVPSQDISERLLALSGGATALLESEDNRIQLYQMSIQGFLQNPIFGGMLNARSYNGGHSAILDTLATYGIFGLGALVFMYRKIYKMFIEPYKEAGGFGYLLFVFVMALGLSLVNTGLWISVLALYAPLMFAFISSSKERGLYEEDSLDS